MKRKINVNRPEISTGEISQRKNFDSVLKQHYTINTKPFFKKPWFLSSVVATVALVTTVVLINTNNSNTKNQQPIADKQQLIKDSIALNEFYAKEEAKTGINPPLKNIDIPYTTYKVNVQQGATLDFETGSTITIPKNAFADTNGKLLKGEVEIKYREFHDPVDFLISGIPMTYDSAGVQYHFESAGMMEILAYQNGQPVNMVADKSINVELASKDESSKFNLYKFDTIKNDWSCIGKDKVVKKIETPVNSNTNSVSKETKEVITKIETKKIEIKKEKEIQIAEIPKLTIEPQKPKKMSVEKFSNNIDVDYKDFPELAVFKGVNWEIGDENKSYDAAKHKYINNTVWESASLKEGPQKGKNFILKLNKGPKEEKLVVYPVFEGKNYDVAVKKYEEKFAEYNKILEKRTKEEKRIEQEYNKKLAQLKKEQEEAELAWKKQQEEAFKKMNSEEKIYRTFSVNNFGVYNCDNPMKYPKGTITNAELLNDKNKKIFCYNVYLVDKKINGMYTYYKNPVTQFTYNPASENIVWTIENGLLYYLKPEDFKNFSSKDGLQQMKMKQAPLELDSAEKIKEFFEI